MTQRVIVVGGSPEHRSELIRSLAGEGFTTETSTDAYQALRKMQDAYYDVAVITLESLDAPSPQEASLTAWDLPRVFRAFNPGIAIVYLGAPLKRRAEAGSGE